MDIYFYFSTTSPSAKNPYLCIMAEKKKPIFNKRIFWDVNFEKLDYDLRANFVIERVFERGDVDDIRQCRRYYGDEKVTEALLKAKFYLNIGCTLPALLLINH